MGVGTRSKSFQGSNKKAPIEKGRWAARGTKPLPDQASIQHVLTVLIIHLCRKVLIIEPEVKITVYCLGLFFGSVICDFMPIPKTYFASKDNVFNQYYVKMSWGWTIVIVGLFIYFTSFVYSCGRKEIIKSHFSRLIIATGLWFFWTKMFFHYVESSTGHSFILVYINLLLVEEAKAIVGWEGIRNLLRNEDHARASGVSSQGGAEDKTTLSSLTREDLDLLKDSYEKWTPVIRLLFLCMTLMSVVGDVMLTFTVIYHHTMPQKVVGGVIAVSTWYITYRFWYLCENSPGLPGKGLFSYQNLPAEREREVTLKRTSSVNKESQDMPMFMGRPIYGSAGRDKKDAADEVASNEDGNTKYLPKGDFFTADSKHRK